MQADDIDAVAKETLGKAIQSARLGEAGKEFTYGNKAGWGLLGDVHGMEEVMKRMQNQLQNQTLQFVDHQAQIDRLQHRVDILTTDAERYYGIRHRFIDVYRRDILRIRKDLTELIGVMEPPMRV